MALTLSYVATCRVTDTLALWHAVSIRASENGMYGSPEDYRAEHDEDDWTSHLMILFEPAVIPCENGFEIMDESCETLPL